MYTGKEKKSKYIKKFRSEKHKSDQKDFPFGERNGKTKPKWKLTKDNGNEEHELELSPNMLRFLGLRNENENKRRHMHALHSSVGYERSSSLGRRKDSWCFLFLNMTQSGPAGRARNVWKEVNENNWQGSAFICFPRRRCGAPTDTTFFCRSSFTDSTLTKVFN